MEDEASISYISNPNDTSSQTIGAGTPLIAESTPAKKIILLHNPFDSSPGKGRPVLFDIAPPYSPLPLDDPQFGPEQYRDSMNGFGLDEWGAPFPSAATWINLTWKPDRDVRLRGLDVYRSCEPSTLRLSSPGLRVDPGTFDIAMSVTVPPRAPPSDSFNPVEGPPPIDYSFDGTVPPAPGGVDQISSRRYSLQSEWFSADPPPSYQGLWDDDTPGILPLPHDIALRGNEAFSLYITPGINLWSAALAALQGSPMTPHISDAHIRIVWTLSGPSSPSTAWVSWSTLRFRFHSRPLALAAAAPRSL
jgi:hypothetical protein